MERELTFEQWMVHIRIERGYTPETIKRYEQSIGIAARIPRGKQSPSRTRRNDSSKKTEDNTLVDSNQ